MISDRYDLDDFIAAARDKDVKDVIDLARCEMERCERMSRFRRGLTPDDKQRDSYAHELRKLVMLLDVGIVPPGIRSGSFYQLRPVFEDLVQRGRLKPAILRLFGPGNQP